MPGNLSYLNIPPEAQKIVLAGNPNTGKSVFFNYLTGIYVDVSNYPGTTLEINSGRFGSAVVIDTPGVYGISSFNDEERIARDIILNADLVVNVVSALSLERDLFLTQQIIDTGKPVIVALNMVDEAQKQGLTIDADLLSRLLGVPVVPTVAIRKQGLAELKMRLNTACPGYPTLGLEEKLKKIVLPPENRGEALLILEGDPVIAARYDLAPGEQREEIYRLRRQHVDQICQQVVRETSRGENFRILLEHWLMQPVTGGVVLLLALWLMYKAIGVFIAGTVVGFAEERIMAGIYEPAVRYLVGLLIPPESIPGVILTGEFGLLTMTVTYLVGLLTPLVISFYFFLSLLEDSGYLPRTAALVDRLLNGIGLNGRGVIPLILGFGCVTMATITTRLLPTSRERLIAIFLLGLTIPCSAQIGVIAGMLAGLGLPLVLLYLTIIFSVLVAAGTLLNNLLPGDPSDLLIDLPPLRVPGIRNVLKKTGSKTFSFLREAAPLFALGALIISALEVTGLLNLIQKALAPLTVGWLNLPAEAANAFIMGIIRRDFGAAGLYSLSLTNLQTVVALVTITLFVPCIASLLVIFKERTKREAVLIWLTSCVLAFFTGGLVAQLARLLSINGAPQISLLILVFLLLAIIVAALAHLIKITTRLSL